MRHISRIVTNLLCVSLRPSHRETRSTVGPGSGGGPGPGSVPACCSARAPGGGGQVRPRVGNRGGRDGGGEHSAPAVSVAWSRGTTAVVPVRTGPGGNPATTGARRAAHGAGGLDAGRAQTRSIHSRDRPDQAVRLPLRGSRATVARTAARHDIPVAATAPARIGNGGRGPRRSARAGARARAASAGAGSAAHSSRGSPARPARGVPSSSAACRGRGRSTGRALRVAVRAVVGHREHARSDLPVLDIVVEGETPATRRPHFGSCTGATPSARVPLTPLQCVARTGRTSVCVARPASSGLTAVVGGPWTLKS
ncbi:hypothetical protein HDG68_003118 [Isoptericola chiayiensis]|nr:hypothetical protein [Isoptericola chiayiensis]